MTWLYSLAVISLGGGGAFGVTRYLTWRARQEEASMPRFRCPRCEQKLRYNATRAGKDIVCPGCNSRITLPTEPTPLQPSERRIGQRLTAAR